jgi:2-polyprenyl-3-methyl-5-hydroxy-6-metoxy-1,4-benzoquinol methylase
MDKDTQQALLELNCKFYDKFAKSFSATRGRIQPGVRQILPRMLSAESILDVGCGNGTLARALQKAGFAGYYVGLDMSGGLLEQAEVEVSTNATPIGTYEFQQVDLADLDWAETISTPPFDWLVSFAVLHHIPGKDLRKQIVRAFVDLTSPEGRVAVSVWQWQNSPRLRKRVQAWSKAGLDPEKLDEGDVLLDWRAGEVIGLRYVHTFSETSLSHLAAAAGFEVIESFYSDGRTGDLALYQVWDLQ